MDERPWRQARELHAGRSGICPGMAQSYRILDTRCGIQGRAICLGSFPEGSCTRGLVPGGEAAWKEKKLRFTLR